jgi:hypothetical protein
MEAIELVDRLDGLPRIYGLLAERLCWHRAGTVPA